MKKSKIIFLDYDGVLNNPMYQILEQGQDRFVRDFDPQRITRLQRICEATGAQVVVTSSWRANKEAREYLISQGIPIIGITPEHNGVRGEEIDYWLQETELDVVDYLILDDETSEYSPEQMGHVICTRELFESGLFETYDCVMGLQEKHVVWATAMLGGEHD